MMSEVMEKALAAMSERHAAFNTMSEADHENTVKMVEKLLPLLPRAAGYRILIAIPVLKEMTAGGIAKPTDTLERERTATVVGYVVQVGPDAYKDKNKFPTGAWCKEKDWIIFRNYAGTRFMIGGFEFRFIHDDAVDGVTEEPSGITRVG